MSKGEGFSSIVLTDDDGNEFFYTSLGSGEPVRVRTRPLDLGSQNYPGSAKQKYIDGILLEIENGSELIDAWLKVRYFDRLKDEANASWEYEFQITSEDEVFYPRFEARYVQLEIEDLFPNVTWELSAIEFYGQRLDGRI